MSDFNSRLEKLKEIQEENLEIKKIIEKYEKVRQLSKTTPIEQNFINMIIAGVEVLETHYLVERKKDLARSFPALLENPVHIKSKEEIEIIKKELEKLLLERSLSTKKIDDKINEFNELQKQEWIKTLTDPNDFVPGKPFSFICHSIRMPNFNANDYWNRFVSCSLITPEIRKARKLVFCLQVKEVELH